MVAATNVDGPAGGQRRVAVSLVVGIASSLAERQALAQLLGDSEALLIVASVEAARELLEATGRLPAAAGGLVDSRTAAVAAPIPELNIDPDRRMLQWLEREVPLTRLEHDVLTRLLGAPGRIWTYERLHLEVWGEEYAGRGSDVHSVVRRLRHKLNQVGAAATVDVIRGVGLRLVGR
ncbi:hypothetical protein GCM10022251_74910 [Phytohabitans flavus]